MLFLPVPGESDFWLDLPREGSAFRAGSCGEEEEEASLATLRDRCISGCTWEAQDVNEDRCREDDSTDW